MNLLENFTVPARQDIMCPFFREPCLRFDCTAFRITRYFMHQGKKYEIREDWTDEYVLEQGYFIRPYCNALNKELPRKKLKLENTNDLENRECKE
jgi:hypothetical protein